MRTALILFLLFFVLGEMVIGQECTNNITLIVLSSSGNAVSNVNITLRDDSNTTLDQGLTDSDGIITFNNTNTSSNQSFNFLSRYPSSQYTADVDSISVTQTVFINSFGSVKFVLLNTIGSFLEGQDFDLYVTDSLTGAVIKNYDTQCKNADEPDVDANGNFVTYSDCPFTNSRGEGTFVFDVLEEDGYFYNKTYTVNVVVNGQLAQANFSTIVERKILGIGVTQRDWDKRADEFKMFSGAIFLLVIFFILVYYIIKKVVLKR